MKAWTWDVAEELCMRLRTCESFVQGLSGPIIYLLGFCSTNAVLISMPVVKVEEVAMTSSL